VAYVNRDDSGKLKANVYHFANDNVWNAENRHRLVVLQPAISPVIKREFSFLNLFSTRRASDRFPPIVRTVDYIYPWADIYFPKLFGKEFDAVQFSDSQSESRQFLFRR